MADDGNPDGNPTGGGTGDVPAWVAQLPAEMRGNQTFHSFKTIGDLGTKFLEVSRAATEVEGLKTKLKDSIPKLAPDSTNEEKNVYWLSLGRPEEAAGYQLDKVDGIDEAMLNEARPEFFNAGLTKDQAKAMVSLEASIWKKRVDAFKQQRQTEVAQQETELKSEWGVDYPTRVENLRRFLEAFSKGFKIKGQPADVKAWMIQTNMGNDPFFIRLIDALAKKFPEDRSPQGGSPGTGGEKGMINLYK